MSLPFVSVKHLLGRQLGLVQCVGGQDEITLLVNERLTGRDPRGQGGFDRGDARVGLCAGARSPSLPIAWRGADGARVEERGLQVLRKTRQRLSGIRFTGKGRAA